MYVCVCMCVYVCMCVRVYPVCLKYVPRSPKFWKKYHHNFSVEWRKYSFSSPWPGPSFAKSNFGILFALRKSRKRWEIAKIFLFPSNRKLSCCHQCECYTSWPWPTISRLRILKCEYLQNANVVHHDLDLHYQSHECWNMNITKTVSANEKCSSITFIEVDICHRMKSLRMLYYVTVSWIFIVKLFKWLFNK